MDIKELRARLNEAVERLDRANTVIQEFTAETPTEDVDAAEAEFTEAEAEVERAQTAVERAEAVTEARKLITPVEEDPAPERTPVVVVGNEPATYRADSPHSYFKDLVDAARGYRDSDSDKRLRRHAEEMRAMSSDATDGGEFIPPTHLQERWAAKARPRRVYADAVGSEPMPTGTDTVTIPRVTESASTDTQADNEAVSSQDPTTDEITVKAKTIAGQVDMSFQAFERSVPGLDVVVFDDLARLYAQNLDNQCLNGSGSGKNAQGVLQNPNITTVTYTDGSPSLKDLYPKIGEAIAEVEGQRHESPTAIFLHPRRWSWMKNELDSDGRPLIPPYAPSNATARFDRVAPERIVGDIHGLPVITDANLPSTNGYSSNEDVILVTLVEEALLWEDSTPRTRVLTEVLSGSLGVRLQTFGFFMYTSDRYPKAHAKIVGNGLTDPFA